jgi:hypothetical protein
VVGDGPRRAVRLEGELDRAGARGGRREDGPGPAAAARVQARRRGREGARLRDEPRPLRAAPERPARRRPALDARVDQLQQAPPVPGVRRHGALEAGRQRRRRFARQRLVPRGPDGLRGPAQRLRRSRRAAAADRGDLRGRAPRDRGKRRELEVGDRPDPDVGDLPRRNLRRPAREARVVAPRVRRARLERREGRRPPQGHADRVGGAARSPDRGSASGRGAEDAGRPHRRGPGTEHGGLAEAQGAGAGGDHGDAAPRRGARQGRQLLHGEPARREGDRALHAQGLGPRELRAALHVLRRALRRRRRLPRGR